jgi:hypothetical protein
MSGESDPQFQSLPIKTCTLQLIIKTLIAQEGNFELSTWTFVAQGNLLLANSQANIFRMSLGDVRGSLLLGCNGTCTEVEQNIDY